MQIQQGVLFSDLLVAEKKYGGRKLYSKLDCRGLTELVQEACRWPQDVFPTALLYCKKYGCCGKDS